MNTRDLDNLSNDDIQKLIAEFERSLKWWRALGVTFPSDAIKAYIAHQEKLRQGYVNELKARIKT
jgi:hypothetical protein